MTLPAHSLGRRTLDHKLQEHLVVGKRYARLGIFKGVSSSLLDEGKSPFYNFQKAPEASYPNSLNHNPEINLRKL